MRVPLAFSGRDLAGAGRFLVVSGTSALTTFLGIAVLVNGPHLRAAPANVVATLLATVLQYELNRRWVWGSAIRGRAAAHLGAFVGLSAVGLALSTGAVALAEGWASGMHLGALPSTLALDAANLGAFGLLTGLKFLTSRRLFALHLATERHLPHPELHLPHLDSMGERAA